MFVNVIVFILCCYKYIDSVPQFGAPTNVTVTFINALSVKVSWNSEMDQIEKHEVIYKPDGASYRVVAVVAANSNAVTLKNLMPDTQYQLSVTAIRSGKKYRSRPVVFRTLESGSFAAGNDTSTGQIISMENPDIVGGPGNSIPPLEVAGEATGYIHVRGIEVAIVVLVLLVWVGAIILFFNRWGKIRMLIPYQPDYKETQLKVPGTGACSNINACPNEAAENFCCSQNIGAEYRRASRLSCTPYWRHSSPADLHYVQPPSSAAVACTLAHQDRTCPKYVPPCLAETSNWRRIVRNSRSEDNIAMTMRKNTLLKYREGAVTVPTAVSVSITSDNEQTLHQLV